MLDRAAIAYVQRLCQSGRLITYVKSSHACKGLSVGPGAMSCYGQNPYCRKSPSRSHLQNALGEDVSVRSNVPSARAVRSSILPLLVRAAVPLLSSA